MSNSCSVPTLVPVDHWPCDLPPDRAILCPSLAGLPRDIALWLAILPIHDANGCLLNVMSTEEFRRTEARPGYAGVCMVDPFRRSAELLNAVAEAGIGDRVTFGGGFN